VIPGGALVNKTTWKPSKKNYLFPVKVISRVFRGIFVSKLRSLYQDKKLTVPNSENIDALLNELMAKEWVVYAKEPFAGPEKLLDYLGRYTHKIAISNHRILNCDKNGVTFKWRDYSDHNTEKNMALQPDEFIRRILNHVVPEKFMRIRHFGFLSNASKAKSIAIIREVLDYDPKVKDEKDTETLIMEIIGIDVNICHRCKKGKFHVVEIIPPYKFSDVMYDTS